MTKQKIKEMIKKFLHQRYRETGDWVMTNCPFAQWTHADGDDRNFSFGISTSNGFHCFTCGTKGFLSNLPRMLSKYSHIPMFDMEDFIKEHMNDYEEVESGDKTITYLESSVIESYPYLPSGVLNLTKDDIRKWNIRFSESNQTALFPVYLNGKINAVKVRGVRTKYFYCLGSLAIKQTGNWYGDWFKPKKVLALVEGERDAILLSRYITAYASLGIPTVAQLEYIAENFNSYPIILFFDNDDAGQKIKKKAVKYLAGACKLYEIGDYCGCKDPAELVEKNLIKRALLSIKPV